MTTHTFQKRGQKYYKVNSVLFERICLGGASLKNVTPFFQPINQASKQPDIKQTNTCELYVSLKYF